MTLRIAINGFGRIGRSVLRALYESGARDSLAVVAINEPADAATIAHLLKYDSTHGRFRGDIERDADTLIVNGDRIALLAQKDWRQLPWHALGIDLVLECTGECHDRSGAQLHLAAGAGRVLVSQPLPPREVDFTVVPGTNETSLQSVHRVVSSASCTTQGVVPIIELLDNQFGIDLGTITTIHSAMNDQPVIDAYHHTDLRKTRAASRSIIPIDTGLAKGVGRILPHLEGRFTAQHLRVPTTNVSALDLTVLTRTAVSVDDINAALKSMAQSKPALIGYSDEPLASCDFNHDPRSAIVDASQTSVAGGRLVKVLIWFDNEWGYANRMIDVAGFIAKFESCIQKEQTMSVIKMTDLDLRGKRVLIRADLNVPVKNGVVTSDVRIRASLPSVELALKQGASVILMSHLGRPVEGGTADENAPHKMAPVAKRLGELLGFDVPVIEDFRKGVDVAPGKLVLLENVRFNKGEKKDSAELARAYAALCDIFVMDAFGTAHRAEASTHGVGKFARVACAGILLGNELDALEKALAKPARPMLAIVAGSKVSTKLDVLNALSEKCDQLIVGGGIANTFLAAAGFNVGKSLCEHDLIETAKAIAKKVAVPLPKDVVVAEVTGPIDDFMAFVSNAKAVVKPVEKVADNDMILDIGPRTARQFADIVIAAKTILWNGPVGVFEADQFGEGTKTLALAIAKSAGFSIAGGGDTLAAVDKYGIEKEVSYISTGGGAFLEYVEGKVLPAVAMLQERAR